MAATNARIRIPSRPAAADGGVEVIEQGQDQQHKKPADADAAFNDRVNAQRMSARET